jgi:hypothetical protein
MTSFSLTHPAGPMIASLNVLTMPTNEEIVAEIDHLRDRVSSLYSDLLIALNAPANIGAALQAADDMSLGIADVQRLERLGIYRGLQIEPWPDRERFDEAADLCIAVHPEEESERPCKGQ